MIAHLDRALRLIVRRGQAMQATFGAVRTLLQIAMRANEARQNIELLLPYGMSAVPDAGDVLVLQIGGAPDHLVALCADNPACRIAGLVTGEFGFSDNQGQQIVFKRTGIVVTTTLGLTVNGNVVLNGALTATGELTAKSTHTVSAHVHPGVQAGAANTEAPTG